MVEAALRTVVRDVLRLLAGEGLPAPHHFYITFRTGHPGVEMPDYLRERYPGDMTIVLQHQYWDLQVEDDGFAVTLSFNDQLQRMRVPYNAVKVFADPGVEFGLQFTLEPAPESGSEPTRLLAGPQPRAVVPADAKPEGAGAEIVALDRFRKK
ncbi:MAG TPA: ClpXP protease specificity-enhancing factor SspB [Geminicoccaceae bacterium]|nr:ClpXP protease specificity-enhancing factor SspB [Geminicoccus sp.]HMU50809.1 ClpXP protease specificity-enhancing factor SspB [Geminicoccaceae bacterium]